MAKRPVRLPVSHTHDLCQCGDYRQDHPDGGACQRCAEWAVPPEQQCQVFRFYKRARG